VLSFLLFSPSPRCIAELSMHRDSCNLITILFVEIVHMYKYLNIYSSCIAATLTHRAAASSDHQKMGRPLMRNPH